jgi:hypothetical protein
VPVQLNWTASDAESGLSKFVVWRSTNGGAYTQADTIAASTTTDTLMLEPGNTYQFVIRAFDVAGNYADASGSLFRLDAYQETTGGVTNLGATYTGAWSSIPWTLAYGGSEKAAQQTGASVSFSFIGRTVSFVGPTFAGAGSVTVFADNSAVADRSLAASQLTAAAVVYTYAFPTGGVHTLKLVTDSAARVDVDAFVVLS